MPTPLADLWKRLTSPCRWAENRLAAYLHGDLSPAERRRLESHLASCPACTQRLAAFQRIHARLAAAAPVESAPLPESLRRRAGKQVSATYPNGDTMNPVRNRTHETLQLAAQAVGLAVVVLIVVFAMRTLSRPTTGAPTGAPVGAPTGPAPAGVEPTGTPLPVSTPTLVPLALNQPVETTLTFAAPESLHAQYRALIEEFQRQNPRITIELISAEALVGSDSLNAPARLMAGADTAVYDLNLGHTPPGLLLDLAPWMAADPDFQPADFWPRLLETYRYGEQTLALPGQATPQFLLADQDKFEQAGVALPGPNWTQAEFLALAQALTRRNRDRVEQYGFVDLTGQGKRVWINEPLRDALSQGRLDTPEAAAALQWYADLDIRHHVMPFLTSGVNPIERDQKLIEQGQAAMWSDSLYNYLYYRQQGRKIALLPFPVESEAAVPVYMKGYFARAGLPYPQAAWQWLSFLSRQILAIGPGDVVMDLPARRSTAERMDYWTAFDAETQAVLKTAAERLSITGQQFEGPAVYLYLAGDELRVGNQTAAEAVAAAQDAYNRQQSQAQNAATSTPLPVSAATEVPAGWSPVIPPTPQPTRITFYNTLTDPATLGDWIQAFELEHPEIQVEPFTDFYQAENADCYAGSTILQAQSLQALVEADPSFSTGNYYQSLLEPFQSGGELFGLPAKAIARVIRFNPALFDAAGLPYPNANWTLDDFLTAAQALTQDTPQGKQWGYVPQLGEAGDLPVFVAAQGARLFDENGWPRFSEPDVVAAVQWYVDLGKRYQVMPLFDDSRTGSVDPYNGQARQQLIESGRAAMWNEYYYGRSALVPYQPYPGGFAPMPVGVKRATDYLYDGLKISEKNSRPQACWEWIKFLSRQSFAAQGLPAWQGALVEPPAPAGQPPIDPARLAEVNALEQVYLTNTWDAYVWNHADFWATQDILRKLSGYLFSDLNVKEALARAQQDYLSATPTPLP